MIYEGSTYWFNVKKNEKIAVFHFSGLLRNKKHDLSNKINRKFRVYHGSK
jgi:hypothetical protein